MRAAMTCLLLLVPAGLVSGRDTDDWVSFSPKGGKFTVKMPAKPKDTSQEIDSAVGKLKVNMYMYEEGNAGVYMVAYTDYPEDSVTEENVKDVLAGAESGGIKGVKGKLIKSKAIKLGKYPGREVTYTVPAIKGTAKSRIFVAGDRLYQVVALGNEEFMGSEEIDFFFGSFKITAK
jgi:hypothetical protein